MSSSNVESGKPLANAKVKHCAPTIATPMTTRLIGGVAVRSKITAENPQRVSWCTFLGFDDMDENLGDDDSGIEPPTWGRSSRSRSKDEDEAPKSTPKRPPACTKNPLAKKKKKPIPVVTPPKPNVGPTTTSPNHPHPRMRISVKSNRNDWPPPGITPTVISNKLGGFVLLTEGEGGGGGGGGENPEYLKEDKGGHGGGRNTAMNAHASTVAQPDVTPALVQTTPTPTPAQPINPPRL